MLAVLAAALVVSSGMVGAEGADSGATGDGSSGEVSSEERTSPYDLNIYASGEAEYPYYSQATAYTALYRSGAAEEGALTVIDAEDRWVSSTPLTAFGLNSVGRPASNSSAEREGASIRFESVFGVGFDLEYVSTFNGVKETITIASRPNTSSDIVFWSELSFDRDEYALASEAGPLEGEATVNGSLYLVDDSGNAAFAIPQAFVMDAPVRTLDPSKNRYVETASGRIAWLAYDVDVTADAVLVAIRLPAAVHGNSAWTYPLVVDPTLQPTIAGTVTLEGESIDQPNGVVVTNGGSLFILNSTVRWTGPYALTVNSGGSVTIINSTLKSLYAGTTWAFDVYGTLTIDDSVIEDTADGVELENAVSASITDSIVNDSAGSGLWLKSQSAAVTVRGNTFRDNADAGIEFSGSASSASSTYLSNTMRDNEIGIKVVSGGVTATLRGNTIVDNAAYGVYCQDGTGALRFNDTTISGSTRGVYIDNCEVEATRADIREATFGVELHDATSAVIRDFSIYSSAASDVYLRSSDLVAVEGNYYEWTFDEEMSSVEVRKRLGIRVVNVTEAPISGLEVEIKDRNGITEVAAITTSGDGYLPDVELILFHRPSDGDPTFPGPHEVVMGTSPERSVHVFVGGKRSVVLHYTGDADDDGLPDSQEDTWENGTWLEAELMAKSNRSVIRDYQASDHYVLAHTDGEYFRTLGWPTLSPATYQFGWLATNSAPGALVNLTVFEEGGSTIVANTTYQAANGSNWYWSAPFELSEATDVAYSLRDITGTAPGLFTVDRAVILRVFDDVGDRTSALPGQSTDPVSEDSDADRANDSLESREEVYPMDAEFLGPDAFDIVLADGWSGRAINHANNTREIFDYDVSDLEFTGSEIYELWVRARKTVSNAADVQMNLTIGGTTTSAYGSLTTRFEWYEGPVGLYNSMDTISIAVYDDDDSNLADGTDWVEVDAIFLAASSANMNLTLHYLSSPTQPDADADDALDGAELNGFFISDIQQGENFTLSDGVSVEAGKAEFDSTDDIAFYEFEARFPGIYKVYIPVKFGASEIVGVGNPLPYFQDLFEMALNDSGANPIPVYGGEYAVFNFSEDPYAEGVYFQYPVSFSFLWDLQPGTYNLTVYVNATAALILSLANCIFKASMDVIYIEKFRLDPTDRDFEDDNVTDGIEIARAMFPLWHDSDYDFVTDWEEYYQGNDGYYTNPVSNDTDKDGLMDSIELGYPNDADDGSTTDPTETDTDGDGLPDGWIDGWFREVRPYSPGEVGMEADGVRQPWEGEDLNLDGDVANGDFSYDTETFESLGAETDPDDFDSDNDGMDDGWELFYWGSDDGVAYIHNPRVDDADEDVDVLNVIGNGANGDGTGDNLTNLQEYAVRSFPFSADHDQDFLEDGTESKVAFRTNVTDGAYDSEAFRDAVGDDWIFWDFNPYDATPGLFYTLGSRVTNGSANAPYNSNWTQHLLYLRDGALLAYNASEDDLYLWLHISDSYDADQSGVLEGTVAIFHLYGGSAPATTSNSPQPSYTRRELFGRMVWNDADSDNDGLIDGYEGWAAGGGAPYNKWWEDVDGDGTINSLDPDSDNDGLPDGMEWSNGDSDFDPSVGETHAFANDTDGDLIADGNDTLPLDFDNDYLTGFLQQTTANGTIAAFAGLEGTWTTNPSNPDTDGDGLLDGLEDANRNGTKDAGETSPRDRDTDDDGMWDGPSMWNAGSAVLLDPGTAAHNADNVQDLEDVPTSQDYLSFLDRPWYVEQDQVNFTSVSLSARAYKVYVNVSAWTSHNNTTFDIGVLLGGTFQFEATVQINRTGLNWTSFAVGVMVPHAAASYTVSVYSRATHFYLRDVRLVPGDVGEQEYGTDPLSNDTDKDGLQDGFEVSLTIGTVTLDSEVAGGSYPITATNSSRMTGDDDDWRSSPVDADTDKDGFRDGIWQKAYEGVPTQFGERAYGTNPGRSDTDGDGWADSTEVLEMGTDPLDSDSDGDGLPDSYEPYPLVDFDADALPNALDNDSDDGVGEITLTDRNSTETISGTPYNLSVVFRTNATDGEFLAPGVWVAAAINGTGDLMAFVFSSVLESLPAGATRLQFATTFGGPQDQSVGGIGWVSTFEAWPVYRSQTGFPWYLYIEAANHTIVAFVQQNASSGMTKTPYPTWTNARETNFLYRETINWSAVLTQDGDNDGLPNALETAFGTTIGVPDTDGDGLADGAEYFAGLNGTNPDTDGDGLTDGYEVSTTGSDPGLPDSDHDGLWDGNFSWFKGHTVNRTVGERINETLNQDDDTDDDGVADGWEAFYYLDPKNPDDAHSDHDLDWMDAWEEFEWAMGENWSMLADNVSWNGTDPTDIDSDNDLMPDGYESHWGLNPLNASDKTLHGDGDGIQNYLEYNLSIVDPSWDTPNEGWYPGLTLNPFSNDTDGDGLTDSYENIANKDVDGDFVMNGVDEDSDDDGLFDDEEVAGWNVSVAPAWALTINASQFLNESGDINWSKFPLWWNSSLPYDNDTDNDGLNDFEEFWNGSNPTTNDTDGDSILDENDWAVDENGSQVWTRATQEMEPPQIDFHGYNFTDCSDRKLGTCANISMTIRDVGSGILTISAQHVGSGWYRGPNVPYFAKKASGAGPLLVTPYWVQVPISGVHDRLGTFKVMFTVRDQLGNEATHLYVDGDTFFETRSKMLDNLRAAPDVAPGGLGYVWGLFYGARSSGVDTPAFFDDLAAGRVTVDQLAEGFVSLPHTISKAGEVFNAAYIDYMTFLALSVNPYVPSAQDLKNLQSNETMYWMRTFAIDPTNISNASAWVKFAIAFWEGSVVGGIVCVAAQFVVTLGTGAAVFAASKTLSNALRFTHMLTKLTGAVQKVLKPLIDSIKATNAYKNVALQAARIWDSMKVVKEAIAGGLSAAKDSFQAFAMRIIREGGAMAARVMHVFVERIDRVAAWMGDTVERITSAAAGVSNTLASNIRAIVRNIARDAAPLADESRLASIVSRAAGITPRGTPLSDAAIRFALGNERRLQHAWSSFLKEPNGVAHELGVTGHFSVDKLKLSELVRKVLENPEGRPVPHSLPPMVEHGPPIRATGYVGTVQGSTGPQRIIVFIYDEGEWPGRIATVRTPKSGQLDEAGLTR